MSVCSNSSAKVGNIRQLLLDQTLLKRLVSNYDDGKLNAKTKAAVCAGDYRRRKRRRCSMTIPPAPGREAHAGDKRRRFLQVFRKQSSESRSDTCSLLLGDVNFLFFIHVAQEQQQRAGAENNSQEKRYPAVHVPASGVRVGYELVKFKNRTTQSGQTYN
jgi:hypothetical protein